MNKLMGFYELKNMQLPSIPWAEYTGNEPFSEQLLWTVRSAVFHGDDLNLPRIVGVTAKEGTYGNGRGYQGSRCTGIEPGS